MAGGILSGPVDGDWRARRAVPEVDLARGMVVTHLGSRFKGAVVRTEGEAVVLRSPNSGMERLFRLLPGAFALDGRPVTLRRPAPPPPGAGPGRTASGSVAAPRQPARVARASRILVEGVHDAELVEKVWGDDLRVEGVVVERLDGVDVLDEVVAAFRPGPDARLGVLVDHLVAGSKEQRIAAAVAGPHVLVTGTPFVDVWQAIRPQVAGLEAWPVIPRGRPWKDGICDALGVHPAGALWKQLLGRVRSYADLEPALVGAVESLIDFVCPPPGD
ncbi:MAG TPA: DUF3097 family protein [Acidimicrobiales bacterium]|nr:DUF3097 family protein [Acidimicrobiales bacterium]